MDIIESLASPQTLAVTLFICIAVASIFTALMLVHMFISISTPSRQHHMIRVSRGGYYCCDSCTDRWNYTSELTEPLKAMASHGWLVLPGDVQYCPTCRIDVQRRCQCDRIPQLQPLSEPRPVGNPYA